MNSITGLKEDLAAYLDASGCLSGARVFPAFPAAEWDYPLAAPAVAVGVEGVEIIPAGLGGYWGDTDAGALRGSAAEIGVRFDLYTPADQGGDGLHRLYEALCDCLMLRETPFGCHRLTCGDTGYDKAAAAYHMSARLALRSALVRREAAVPIEQFRLVRRE